MPRKLKGGGEVGSMRRFKDSLKRTGGLIVRVKNEGINVRFLTEPDKWFKYYEHYMEDQGTSIPCTADECEGCEAGVRASLRYLANVVDLGENKVVPLLIPKSLAELLEAKYNKHNTLRDRDYELSSTGTGLNTKYQLDPEPVSKFNAKRYEAKMHDLEEIVQGMLPSDEDDEDDEMDDYEDDDLDTDDEDEDEEDEDDDPAPPRRPAKKARSAPAKKRTLPAKKSSRTLPPPRRRR
jgi:hypothetical protein